MVSGSILLKVSCVTINWQIIPFFIGQEGNYCANFQLTLSLTCLFSAKFKDPVCSESGATCITWGPVSSPECSQGVSNVALMTPTGAHKSGLISFRGRSWEKFAGKRQLLAQTFQLHHLTPRVSRVLITASATWHLWHGTRAITVITVSGDSWYQDHSYLNFVGNYQAVSSIKTSHNIQGYCLFTLGS